jgi:predicted oxidoreductase (fatty acid repression mutant protein)
MDAIRQFIDVKNHSFQVTLPADFNAQRVEVIILPSDNNQDQLTDETKKMLENRLEQFHKNTNDVHDFDQLLDELENEI